MNQELQLGKYEFYPNEDELERLALIASFFENGEVESSALNIEELLAKLDS
jgi:hypothetical protein